MNFPHSNSQRLYFDHAATGWPKTEAVYRAVELEMRRGGAAAGRGVYRQAVHSGEILANCRRRAAQVFNSDPQGHWVLTSNGTQALNLALHGLLRSGDQAITTAADHNSVLRPLEWLRENQGVEYHVVPCDQLGRVSAADVLNSLQPNTRLLAISHASNVTGAIQPIADITAGLRKRYQADSRPLLLVDAAQSAGLLPIDLTQLGIDVLATPGHKSLGGPLGTGLLYLGPRAAAEIRPLLQGGTGTVSDQLEMPTELPAALEAGNANVPALAGLAVALEQVAGRDLAGLAAQLERRTAEWLTRLHQLPGVRIISSGQLPIVSLTCEFFSPQELAALLDAEFGIETRAGLHCAPLIHAALDSCPAGTLRISFSAETTDDELEQLCTALTAISAAMVD